MWSTAAQAAAASREIAPGASVWLPDHVRAIADAPLPETALITAADLSRPVPGMDLWDFWPVQEEDGRVATIEDGELWMALSAPAEGDPALRHDRARIRLVFHGADGAWRDLGPALPDGWSPGSREWSGSAIVDAVHREVLLFFTAAGRRGEARVTYEQRLFQTRAALGPGPSLSGWAGPIESVASDGDLYHPADQAEGAIGTIKAFRDPAFFRDPADGSAWLLFAASLGRSASAFNGAIGLARANDASLERWTLMAPLLSADGLNNELERPHLLVLNSRYRLFWSTQTGVFAPDGPRGPIGLYAMTSCSFDGVFAPEPAGGLILCNPKSEPAQAYSWTVSADRSIASFVDCLSQSAVNSDPDRRGRHRAFGGCVAPSQRLHR